MGMTRSTSSRLVDDLIAGGFVREGDPVVGSRGRPATPLSPNPYRFVAIGLEINVDRIVGTTVNLAGDVLGHQENLIDTVSLGPDGCLRQLTDLAELLEQQSGSSRRILGRRLAVPGLVARDGHTVLRGPNIGWHGVCVDSMPVTNDIDCSAVSLLKERGDSHKENTFLYVSGEAGVGAAVCIDGELKTGRHGWATELGHVTIHPDGPTCACGARGCLEVYAGLPHVLKTVNKQHIHQVRDSLEAGDQQCLGAIAPVGEALGIALSSAINLLDVPQVLLGGNLAVIFPWLAPHIRAQLASRVLWASLDEVKLEPVTNPGKHPAFGAAWMVILETTADLVGWLD